MSSCFSCGKDFNDDVNAVLRACKRSYLNNGIVRYFYKLEQQGEVFICRASSFNTILENEIKPNFHKGAEWSHIADFT
jgi:hypothetical protein